MISHIVYIMLASAWALKLTTSMLVVYLGPGVALYNSVFKTVPLKKMLLGAMLLGVTLGSTQLLLVSGANRALGLSDELFVLGDSVILTVLGQVGPRTGAVKGLNIPKQ